jgi:hypothetical protein
MVINRLSVLVSGFGGHPPAARRVIRARITMIVSRPRITVMALQCPRIAVRGWQCGAAHRTVVSTAWRSTPRLSARATVTLGVGDEVIPAPPCIVRMEIP